MIPLTIQIKNFLSYGPELQTIDFQPYQLICLAGKNGHGKSALLDAITWAVWGQARKVGSTVKADQGLVKLGQTQMLVILDFICNGAYYRIRREFAITYGKPYAALDFALISQDGQEMAALTEKTIRDTQKKIEDTLRLDYDAFINSAFLRQGQANEFSKKAPKERKEILANILGLQRFEELRQAAQDQVRNASAQQTQLSALQEKLVQQLTQETTVKAQHTHITTQLEQEQQTSLALQKEEIALQQAAIVHQKKELELHHVQLQVNDQRAHEQEMVQRLQEIVHQWRTTHHMLIKLPEYATLLEQKKDLELLLTTHATKLEQRLSYKEQLLTLQQELMLYRQQQEQRMHSANEEMRSTLHQAELACKQAEQLATTTTHLYTQRLQEQTTKQNNRQLLVQEIATQAQAAALYKQEEKVFEKRKAFYQQWLSQITWLKKENEATAQKIELCHEDASTSCPLCEQNVSAARKKFIKQKLLQTEHTITRRLQRLTTIVSNLKLVLIEQHKKIGTLKKQLEAHALAEHTLLQYDKDLVMYTEETARIQIEMDKQKAQAAQALAQYTQLHAAYSQHKEQAQKDLLTDTERTTREQSIKELTHKLNELNYNMDQHKADQQRYDTLKSQLQQHEQMQQLQHAQHGHMAAVSALIVQLKTLRGKLHEQQQLLAAHKELQGAAHKLHEQQQQLQEKLLQHAAYKETLLEQRGRIEQQLATFATMLIEQKEQDQKLQDLRQQIDDYQTIAAAFSKNGMQALLIEDAIPEIEHAANDLLTRLTDNQAHIMIESLRDLKSGGTKETLEIKISDSAGIRPYEMFSGGEAFRIDFALRIAISKLLARRAGTSLQTLIIDEGFGSQDEEGIAHIMDAIYRIQDDFRKIIIVSHLPTMKDQFPVHFLVHKGPQGSNVQVIEQA